MNPNSAKEYKGPAEATLWNFLIALFLFALLIFLYDGFIVHNIPVPEVTYASTGNNYSPLSKGEPFEGAKLISAYRAHHDFLAYLLEYEGETHLLVYEFHFVTNRGTLLADLIVDASVDQTYTIKGFLCKYIAPVSGGKLGDVYYMGINKSSSMKNNPVILIYFLSAGALAFVEAVIYDKLRKLRQ